MDKKSSDIERRYLRRELRATGEAGARKITGYASVFNTLSEDLGGWREMILPGAFTKAIAEDDVRALNNHNPEMVLGRLAAGTLALAEDETGLRYDIDPPDTQYARDLLTSIERGDVDQSSFSFRAVEESWRNPTPEQPLPVRIIHEARLYDVSPVTFPAYPQTSVAVRDMAKQLAGQATGDLIGPYRQVVRRLSAMRRELELKSIE